VTIFAGALDYLLGGPKVGGQSEERLRRWLALPATSLALPHARARYVVVATETIRTGRRRDRLVAIDAVAVEQMQVDLAGCFAAVLWQPHAGAGADVLRHGIAGKAQQDAVAPELTMLAFLEFLGRSPLVVFGADGGRATFERSVKAILGVPFRHSWIDLAALLPALFPEAGCTNLGDWLQHRGLADTANDDARPGAIVTAQLLQVALAAATRSGLVNAWQLIECQQAGRVGSP